MSALDTWRKNTCLAWPSWLYMTSTWLGPFMPFLPHRSQQQEGTLTSRAASWRNTGLLLLQKVLLFLKPVRRLNLLAVMEESAFNDVGWEERHARYWTVAPRKEMEKPGMRCQRSSLPISPHNLTTQRALASVVSLMLKKNLPVCQASIQLSTIGICGLRG